jgi:hypothetical protein
MMITAHHTARSSSEQQAAAEAAAAAAETLSWLHITSIGNSSSQNAGARLYAAAHCQPLLAYAAWAWPAFINTPAGAFSHTVHSPLPLCCSTN